MGKFRSIKTKLIMAFSALVLLACIVLGFVSVRQASGEIQKDAESNVALIANQSAGLTEAKLNTEKQILQSIARLPKIESMEWDVQKPILENQAESTEFISMGIVDKNGDARFSDGSALKLKEDEYIQKAFSGESAISDLMVDEEKDEVNLIFASPIEIDGEVVGALLGKRDGYYLSQISDEVKFGEEGYGYIIDGDGTDIAHPNRDFVKNSNNSFELYENDKSLESVVQSFTTVLEEREGIDQYSYDGEDYYVGYHPIEDTDWIMIVTANAEEVLQSIPPMQRNIAIVAGIIFIVSFIIVYLVGSMITEPIIYNARELNRIADFDLSQDLSEKYLNKDSENGDLTNAIQRVNSNLRNIMKEIGSSSERVSSTSEELTATAQQSALASREVATTAEDIAKGASEQAISTEEGSTKAILLGNIVEENTKNMNNLNLESEKINEVIKKGLDGIENLNNITKESDSAIRNIYNVILETNENSNKIGQASDIIASIAEQTNLLALNAAIEAARAGEAGKGFAVVADEIRKLAEESTNSTVDIEKIVKELQENSETGVNTIERVMEISKEQTDGVSKNRENYISISEAINSVEKVIDQLGRSQEETDKMKNDIIDTLESLSAIAQENSAGTEQVTASAEEQHAATEEIANASEDLAKLSHELHSIVEKMKIS